MKAKFILGCLLLFTASLLAQESFPLNIRTDDKSKFILYIDDMPQSNQPVSMLRCPMRPGKAVVKIVFQNPSYAPIIQEVDCQQTMPAITLRKKNKKYFLDGWPVIEASVDLNMEMDRGMFGQYRQYCCERCKANKGRCCTDDDGRNNNGNGGPGRNPYPSGDGQHMPPGRSPYFPNGTLCQAPTLSELAFLNLKKKVSDAYFSSDKAKEALRAIESHCLTANQVATLVKMIADFTTDQFMVAKNGYMHMYNTEDFDVVIEAVGSADHRKQLREFATTAGGPRTTPNPHPHPFPETHDRPGNSSPGNSYPRCEQPNCQGFAMSNQEFEQACQTINSSSFEDTKLQQAKLITSKNCLSVAQIRTIIRLLTFEDSKLDFAKYAYDRSHDRKNFYLVSQEFTFDTSKSAFTEYLKRN
ncbi:MAG: DUF4476 domain-containing protein [Chitinophagaceae bacterium]|nr:DUF4476 domain-containing protein [Chitinophagaceae bacterium]